VGHKIHPYGFRLGVNKTWKSRWFAKKDYADLLFEDVTLREQIKRKLRGAGISSIEIERAANKLMMRIHTARPGIIIGRKGSEIDKLRNEIQERTGREVHIDITEVHRAEMDAQLVAEAMGIDWMKRDELTQAIPPAYTAQRMDNRGPSRDDTRGNDHTWQDLVACCSVEHDISL